MIIAVDGEKDSSGVADKAFGINYDNNLEGPISSVPAVGVDTRRKQFTLLGITVVVIAGVTSFDGGASFATLAQNDFVEITGFYDANGDLQATYLKRVETVFGADTTIVEAIGFVTSYNGTNQFLLHIARGKNLTVHLSGSTSQIAIPGGQITNGQLVTVSGTLLSVSSQSLTAV